MFPLRPAVKSLRCGYGRSSIVVLVAASLASCSHSVDKVSKPPGGNLQLFSQAVPLRRDANDAGRFLAGLPGAAGSPYSDLERQEAWRAHSRELDERWSKFETGALPAMREFQLRELNEARSENRVVFYPFSGPDALFVRVLFPLNPVYVLVGLEPPGTVPDPAGFARKDLGRYLGGVRSSVYSELHRSFFITKEMDSQFRGQVSDGLLPTILHLLARTGHTILGYRYVRIDGDGRLVERDSGTRAAVKRAGNPGVEIDFRSDADRSDHKLIYLSVNLSDEKLRENEPFLRFVSKLGGMTTYMKATSYMPHHKEFSIFREQVLEFSAVVLQDDSGIPYRFFDRPADWRVQLYGDYNRPYGSFRWLEQPDLKKVYATVGRKQLGFRIGYGFSRIPSNLLLAIRNKGGAGA